MTSLHDIAPMASIDVVATRRRRAARSEIDALPARLNDIAINTPCWTFLTQDRSRYDDVEGQSYHYLRTTRAGNDRIARGDWALMHHGADSKHEHAGRVFAVARIGRVVSQGDDRYAMFDRYLSLSEGIPIATLDGGDPRTQARNPINPIPASVVAGVLSRVGATSMADFTVPRTALDLGAIEAEAAELRLPRKVHLTALAALRSGKHLILTGPPGTGKSTYALALGRAAVSVGLAEEVVMTTGTSDWTTSDTVGGYRLDPSLGAMGGLTFSPGLMLESLAQNSWLVIDELNRADIDKAIGQFFSVLSGQPVTLPFVDDAGTRVSIVPPDGAEPPGTDAYRVPRNWSLIATMNERDRDLLFTLSEAFMRRFAVIRLGPPESEADWRWIFDHRTGVSDPEDRRRLLNLAQAPDLEIGPAVVIDVADFVSHRRAISREAGEMFDRNEAFASAVEALVGPQLTALFEEDERRARKWLEAHVIAAKAASGADERKTDESAADAAVRELSEDVADGE